MGLANAVGLTSSEGSGQRDTIGYANKVQER